MLLITNIIVAMISKHDCGYLSRTMETICASTRAPLHVNPCLARPAPVRAHRSCDRRTHSLRLATNAARNLHVLGHYGLAFSVDAAQVRVLKQSY